MKVLIPVIAIAIILGFVLFRCIVQTKIEELPMKFYSAKISDAAEVFRMLKETGKDQSYAIFVFNSEEALPDSHIELQFSIERGSVGFDWVLLGPEKERDKAKFESLARERGYEFTESEENGVRFIRVDRGDVLNLCRIVMKDLYKVSEEQPMEVIAKEFEVTGLPLSTE